MAARSQARRQGQSLRCFSHPAPLILATTVTLESNKTLLSDTNMNLNLTDERETEIKNYIHDQLAHYSRSHYTLNYQEVTAEWVFEVRLLLYSRRVSGLTEAHQAVQQLQPVPPHDPRLVGRPADPLLSFFSRNSIESLEPYTELPTTSKAVISLLKSASKELNAKGPCRSDSVLREEAACLCRFSTYVASFVAEAPQTTLFPHVMPLLKS